MEHSPALPFFTRAVESLGHCHGKTLLDIACGKGRHLCAAANAGFTVTGVDIDADALAVARTRLGAAPLYAFDVEAHASLPPEVARFDVIVTTFFLFRPLIPTIAQHLNAGGQWWLETFHEENRRRHGHPRRPQFALSAGEAEKLAAENGLSVKFVDEGEHDGVFTTQLIAQSLQSPVGFGPK